MNWIEEHVWLTIIGILVLALGIVFFQAHQEAATCIGA
jgi:uncharacterized membrane protein